MVTGKILPQKTDCHQIKLILFSIDGDRVLVGTHDGLAVYENGKWNTYTTKDGLAHNGVVSIDVSELTGDVWIGTLGGSQPVVRR